MIIVECLNRALNYVLIYFIKRLMELVFPDCDHGGPGSEVRGPKPDRLLHHGGGGRREAADGPSWSLQTAVSSSSCSLKHCRLQTSRWTWKQPSVVVVVCAVKVKQSGKVAIKQSTFSSGGRFERKKQHCWAFEHLNETSLLSLDIKPDLCVENIEQMLP